MRRFYTQNIPGDQTSRSGHRLRCTAHSRCLALETRPNHRPVRWRRQLLPGTDPDNFPDSDRGPHSRPLTGGRRVAAAHHRCPGLPERPENGRSGPAADRTGNSSMGTLYGGAVRSQADRRSDALPRIAMEKNRHGIGQTVRTGSDSGNLRSRVLCRRSGSGHTRGPEGSLLGKCIR